VKTFFRMRSHYAVFNDQSVRSLSEMQKRKAYPPLRTSKNTVTRNLRIHIVHGTLRTYIILSPSDKGKII